jgi:fucose 4-O-acetylase-like acetyltransferase
MSTALVLGMARRSRSLEEFERWRPRLLAGLALVALIGGSVLLASGVCARPPFTDAMGRPIGLPWSLDLLPFVLSIFIAGVLFCRAQMLRDCPTPTVVIVGACAVLAVLVSSGVSLDLNYRRMTSAWAVIAGIVAGIGLVFALATLVTRVPAISRAFAYLGSASLVILLLHSPLQKRVLEALVAQGISPWIAVVLSVSITVALIAALDIGVLRRVRALGWVVYPRREVPKPA